MPEDERKPGTAETQKTGFESGAEAVVDGFDPYEPRRPGNGKDEDDEWTQSGGDNPFLGMSADELVAAAGRIDPRGDRNASAEELADARARARELRRQIMEAAVAAGFDDSVRGDLIAELHRAGKFGIRTLNALWKEMVRRQALSAEEREERARRAEEEAAAERKRQRLAREVELEIKVLPLALDLLLMERFVLFAAEQGIVNERAGILGVQLTLVSRLHRTQAIACVRLGAPAGGKNYPVERLFSTVSRDSLIRASGGSPKSLVYMGGADDTQALKHTCIYVPEAASLLVREGEEKEVTQMLRTLISEGELDYPTVIDDGNGNRITVRVHKEGPIACLITSARDNIEPEMMTRLLVTFCDESLGQTQAILSAVSRRARGDVLLRNSDTDLELWQAYQEWLELGGPYEVVVPFADALRAAWFGLPLPLRVRRDMPAILIAVYASAIAHKAQRATDDKGRLIATLDDYHWAHEAFATGLACFYHPQASAGVIRLIKALESLRAEQQAKEDARDSLGLWGIDMVKATYSQIAGALGIASMDVIGVRIKAALTAGAIEVTNPEAPRAVPRRYRILISAKELESRRLKAAIPTPARVRALSGDPEAVASIFKAINAALEEEDDTTSERTDQKRDLEEDAGFVAI